MHEFFNEPFVRCMMLVINVVGVASCAYLADTSGNRMLWLAIGSICLLGVIAGIVGLSRGVIRK